MSPDNKRAKELTQAAGVMPPAKVELKGVAFNPETGLTQTDTRHFVSTGSPAQTTDATRLQNYFRPQNLKVCTHPMSVFSPKMRRNPTFS